MLAARGTEQDIEDPDKDEERKYDGTRAFVIKDGDNAIMSGRSWISDYAPDFPETVVEIPCTMVFPRISPIPGSPSPGFLTDRTQKENALIVEDRGSSEDKDVQIQRGQRRRG